MTTTELDYNDQCDIAFGRIRRLLEEHTECDHVGDLDDVGLDLSGLGLSGEQVQMAFDQAKADAARLRELKGSIESAWAVIANASDWDDPSRAEWRTAAERWRDRYVLGGVK